MKKAILLILTAFLVVTGVTGVLETGSCRAESSFQATVNPPSFNIGTFYHGTSLEVQGTIPEDQEVIVRFVGIPADLHLKKKGKAFGLLWMNKGSIECHNVPNVLILCVPKPWSSLEKGDEKDPESVWRLGFDALEEKITIHPEEDASLVFRELVKLKQKEKLYKEIQGAIRYESAEDGSRTFHVTVPVPARLTPGNYRLEVYAVKGGRIVASSVRPIQVGLVGVPAFIKKMAFDHALLHGILATLVAICGGLLMGVIFGAGKGAH